MRRLSWVRIFVAINVVVFILWRTQIDELSEAGMNSWMARNFLVSWSLLAEGRLWTLLTSVFSHNSFLHIFINLFVLMNFGPIVERVLGPKRFFKFYLTAGVISSLSHAAVSAYIIGDPSIPALGASGAISGIIMLFSALFPREKILLFGLIPVPAGIGALLFVGIDVWGLIAQAEGGGLSIGHGAHLGGAFTGLIYYFVLRRRARIAHAEEERRASQFYNP